MMYVFGLFLKTDLCSAISLKRPRRELSIDVDEHRSILKDKSYQNKYHLRRGFTPKAGIAGPEMGVFTVNQVLGS